jgi:hypothetical protein
MVLRSLTSLTAYVLALVQPEVVTALVQVADAMTPLLFLLLQLSLLPAPPAAMGPADCEL